VNKDHRPAKGLAEAGDAGGGVDEAAEKGHRGAAAADVFDWGVGEIVIGLIW
jgi:hypothetical protein